MDNPGSLDEFNELDEIVTPRPRIFEPYALDPIPNNPNRLRDAFLPDDSSEFSSLEDVMTVTVPVMMIIKSHFRQKELSYKTDECNFVLISLLWFQ